jgi:uncharacterized protein DUF6457
VSDSDDAKAMSEWVTAVVLELGLEGAVDSGTVVDMVLDLTSDVAHGVSRPAAPVTAFLLGIAAGRADDPAVAGRDYAGKVSRLAAGWGADTERALPANDQSQRA